MVVLNNWYMFSLQSSPSVKNGNYLNKVLYPLFYTIYKSIILLLRYPNFECLFKVMITKKKKKKKNLDRFRDE